MAKKAVLRSKDENRSNNLIVYAISSAETDLSICQKINLNLNIRLQLDADYEIPIKNQTHSFRRYHYEDEELIEKYDLFVNRSDNQFLFPEIKKVDFVLIIHTEAHPGLIESAIQGLKGDLVISAIYKVDPASLRSLKRLPF